MEGRVISWFPLERIGELESAILDQLEQKRRARRRDALACALGLMGLRSGEVRQLVIGDLLIPLRKLKVRTLKGGPDRALDLDESLIRQLVAYRGLGQRMLFSKFGPGDLLLPNCRGGQLRREQPNNMAKELFDRILTAGHGLTFHSLRHTFAMRLYEETRDLFLTQQKLGHSSVATTEIYAYSRAQLPEACLVRLQRGERSRAAPLSPAEVNTVIGILRVDEEDAA